MLDYADEQNRFYRRRFEQAGLTPADIVSRDDMLRLPILTKQEIRCSAAEMISDGFTQKELMKFKTGGSTGRSLELYATEECSEMRNACARRHDRWSGWEAGEPIGALWGNPDIPTTMIPRLRHWLLTPIVYLDTMEMNEESVLRFSRDWEKIRPTLLFGHAHSIYILAGYVSTLKMDRIRPKAVISTSMMLLPHERDAIERTFGVRVFDR